MFLALSTFHLTMRSLKEAVRQPALAATDLFIPIFFFFVVVGAIGNAAGNAFGVDNYAGFQMPVAILQGAAGAANGSGLGMVTDIERGYFDKLMLSPVPRLALVLARLAADSIRVMVVATVISVVALVSGAGMETGPAGAVILILISGAFGLAYSGIGLSIALRTGSPQASQLSFLVFFPLLFLSPAFAPKEFFSGWLEFLATINPVTYVLEGMRALVLDGWEWDRVGYALMAISGFGTFTLVLTLSALRSRTA